MITVTAAASIYGIWFHPARDNTKEGTPPPELPFTSTLPVVSACAKINLPPHITIHPRLTLQRLGNGQFSPTQHLLVL